MKGFKEFAMRGNVVDLAVAVIIGAAFGKIITSFVNDILMPPIGMALGNVDFTDLKYILQKGIPAVMNGEEAITEGVAEVAVNYGIFIQYIIDFLIIALAVFMVVKAYMRTRKKKEEEPAPAAAPPAQEVLLTEIRDLLKKQNS